MLAGKSFNSFWPLMQKFHLQQAFLLERTLWLLASWKSDASSQFWK